MGKFGQNDNQQSLSELERQRPNGGGHTDPARCGPAARAFLPFIPPRFSIV